MYHLILLTGHNKFLSPSYHQNVHRKIVIFSNHKQACMSPQPHNALGHALQIEVFLGQVVLELEGHVGVCHGNKGDALGLVVDKVVQRRHESTRVVLKHVHDGLVEFFLRTKDYKAEAPHHFIKKSKLEVQKNIQQS
jgi:hypothetical protein